jgi:hypothetical protein
MTAALGLLWFLGVVTLWAVLSGLSLLLWRDVLRPLVLIVVGALLDRQDGEAWPWWI